MTDDSKPADVPNAGKRKPHQFQPGNKAAVGHGAPRRIAALRDAIEKASTSERVSRVLDAIEEMVTNAEAESDRIAAAKVWLERVLGRPREQPSIDLPVVMPSVATLAGVVEGQNRVWQAVNSGTITIEDARPYFEQLERTRVAIEGAGFEARLEAMRAEIAAMRERA